MYTQSAFKIYNLKEIEKWLKENIRKRQDSLRRLKELDGEIMRKRKTDQ